MKTKILFLSVLTSTLLLASTGEELTQKHCASCHLMTIPTPDMIPTMKAPAMDAVAFHINLAMEMKKDPKAEGKKFIEEYVVTPVVSKSVCESNKVANFGVMPSLKGKVSPEDLSQIAEYVMENFPKPDFVAMIKEIQKNDKMNGLMNSPFLINNEGLPHLTSMLVQNWDKATLGLSSDQKAKLLVVRQETIGGIKALKPKIALLEAEIKEALVDGEEVQSLDTKVDEIAKLKAQATKIHLKCISNTISILSEEQLALLLPFWDS